MDKKNIDICDIRSFHENSVLLAKENMPNEKITGRASLLFKALGDETRLKIVCALSQGEMCVCDLAQVLGASVSAVSHQLSTLRRAGLITFRRNGKEVFYKISDGHVAKVLEMGIAHAGEETI